MKLIDMHCDSMGEVFLHPEQNILNKGGHLDLSMIKDVGGTVQFFALFMYRKCIEEYGAYDLFHKMYDTYCKQMELNRDYVLPVLKAADIEKNAEARKISSLLTIEDGVFLDGHIERVDEAYEKGVRLITLLWNFENSLGFPSSDDPAEHMRGLKPFGIEAVERMNELGIIVDVSHSSEGGFYDVAKYSKKPFIASHSCARALCGHRRNLTDDQLKVLGEKGGVAGINFYGCFLQDDCEYPTVELIMKHMRYMIDKAGIESVGFGSDFDGIDSAGELENYTGFKKIIAAMEKEYTDDQIEKICYGNAMRVIKEVIG